MPREQAGASLLSRLVGVGSGLGGGFRSTIARRDQIAFELFRLRVGEHGGRTRGRHVVDRRIGPRSVRALWSAVGQAAERGRQVIGDRATGRATRKNDGKRRGKSVPRQGPL